MDLEQFVADSLENTSIARYRALYSGDTRQDVNGGTERQPDGELGACWFDGLEPLDGADG